MATSPDQNSTAYRFAAARLADFEAVAGLFEALHRFNATLDAHYTLADNWHAQLRAYFERSYHDPERALWLLVWHAEQPVGLLVVELHVDSPLFKHRTWAELTAIYVTDEHRRSQLGVHLVARAQVWAAERGFDRLELYVTATNERAKRFYRRCGLQPVQEIWRLTIDAQRIPDMERVQHYIESGERDLLEYGYHALLDPEQHDD